ncbi:hypothetical protein [Deinococcus soli (ex Cha et al. 2016)]|uniref:Methylthioribose-1-phosphate isomerase n=2 Tax=Deinococcus soli (ex Cha et al. 2016) TaxID=1309411 RepID=A0AAE4BNF3_9DEIO|nr:hypothetical protein [Deinococcus soli (ex Cha et al. 2016)]MDR6218646.1 methylthioribose-1-phosphate isomerase [Deinococcus soli (ex Cha et al. 2016)]MDR6328443.1 methylthioribose-1-phosphate isomerase [Deinococcus soli (ex Cha et al. 2016)]MDR6753054.1 methylthioribose-1-phosphate isomerase [Deinococcus soli (ex Cha et al. 2016)]
MTTPTQETPMTLTARARAAQQAQHAAHTAAETDHAAHTQYTQALNVLARVVPAVLGVPFTPEHARPLRVNSNFTTATVTIDGLDFQPAYDSRSGLSLSAEHVTDLLIGADAHWYGNPTPSRQWLRVTNLNDVAAALDAIAGGTVGALQAFWHAAA